MADLISSYWVLLAIAGAIGLGTGFWILSSRRHVDIRPIEIGQNATQTLARMSRPSINSDSIGYPPLPFAITTDPDVRPDDLLRIKGVGPKLARMLMDMGITHYSQIADWSASDIAAVDQRLGVFAGRIERDSWIEQARLLDADDLDGFKERFGNLVGTQR